MATREKNIVIEEEGTNSYRVYTDHPAWKIKNIEGVSYTGDYKNSLGYISIDIDPRYNTEKVLREIEGL